LAEVKDKGGRLTVSVYRVLQMRGGGYADVLPVLQVPDNKADAVPCERLLRALCISARTLAPTTV